MNGVEILSRIFEELEAPAFSCYPREPLHG